MDNKKTSVKSPVKTSFVVRAFGSHSVSMISILICSIILLISGVLFYKTFKRTKLELESCRSSCE
jgi:hypothetical protein